MLCSADVNAREGGLSRVVALSGFIQSKVVISVYAIVRAGGRQEKVSVGDVLTIDRVAGEAGSTIELSPVLLVDGEKVTSDADALAKVKVSAEVVEATKGPKIQILRYKNKSGYRRRQGHRSKLTRIKVTGIA